MSLTAIAFLLGYFGSCFLALTRHPIHGIYAYMLAFYAFPPGRWWGHALPDLRWSLTASVVTLIGFYLYNAKTDLKTRVEASKVWSSSLPVKAIILFTIWLWIQNSWALSSELHYEASILYTKYIVLFFVFYRILDSEENIYRFCLAHVLGCAYLGWVAYSTTRGGRFEDIGSPGINDANAFATHMATGLVTASFLLFRAKTKMKMVLLGCIPFILNGVILTQSRGAMLGVFCAGITAFFIKPDQYKKAFYYLSILAVIGFIYLASDTFIERMQSMKHASDTEQLDNSAKSRIFIIQAQIKMFAESPILGHGHRGTAALSPFYLDRKWLTTGKGKGKKNGQAARSSHNTFFSILVEQGILGALIYFAVIIWSAITIIKVKRMDGVSVSSNIIIYNVIVGCSLTILLSAGQFADYLKQEVMIWTFVIMLAYLRLIKVSSDQNSIKS